ncbi:gamma-carboxymuconolactone decarboxylase [Halobacteriales archaeon QS_4_66_20]|nr:MAG: gamma-carboxymuconolactone decarboxylase [Halobacteriales archaeon QS_4_66_20]
MSVFDDPLDPEAAELKATFQERRNFWHPAFEALLHLDREFFEKYLALSTHAWENGSLDPKVTELVYVAIYSSPGTHISEADARRHVGNALDQGATVSEVLTVLEILSTAGIHSVLKGVPILAEEGGIPEPDSDAERDAQERARANFEEKRGYWDDGLWADLLAIDHQFLQHYTDYSAHVAHYSGADADDTDDLDPLVKEFIYIALDASLPAFYLGGLRAHIENALEYGASHGEILEVLEVTSELGSRSLTSGVPILVEEAEERGLLGGGD